MSRKSNFFSNLISICIPLLLILGLIAGLMSALSWFSGGGYNEFTVSYGDTVYTQNANNILIQDSGMFTLSYKDKDTDDIKVKLTAVELYEDFYFSMDEKEYSWNKDVVTSNVRNFTSFVDIQIDNEKNTVIISSNLTNALKKAGKSDNLTLLSCIPEEDMFMLEITSGNTSIEIGCTLCSAVQGLVLSQNNVFFE